MPASNCCEGSGSSIICFINWTGPVQSNYGIRDHCTLHQGLCHHPSVQLGVEGVAEEANQYRVPFLPHQAT
ncbi:hypothetical protein E2320_002341 [Naja naja]|nr:hypothetical protein E2320_002341 [Naja naja]